MAQSVRASKGTKEKAPGITARVRQTWRNSWKRELEDFARAFGGAFLFGIPLLYTMEMWWLGTHMEAWKLILYVFLTFGLNTLMVYFSGFKRQRTLLYSVMQSLDAIAVGVVAATTLLLILNRIQAGDSLSSSLGKIVVQTVPLSLGASIANAIFSEHQSREGQPDVPVTSDPWHAFFNDVGATVGGGLFIGFSIAPTDEVGLLAAHLTWGHALALVIFSLLLTYLLVFVSAFDGKKKRKTNPALPFQRPFTETTLAYGVSLLLAGVVLYLFNQLNPSEPPSSVLAKVLVLGLPISIGGAAGRVLL